MSQIAAQGLTSVVSVTNISVQEVQSYFGQFGRNGRGQMQLQETTSCGSGVIVYANDEYLYMVTNYHVVEGATTLSVTFVDDQTYEAALCGYAETMDIALLKVAVSALSADTLSQISVVAIGDSDELVVGEQVVAIGNALGYGQSVTTGIVSALDRSISTDTGASAYIQTDAAINPGNSGGALIDLNGNVIGINAAKTASTEVEGMGFAIPISKAQDILNSLMTKKTRVAVSEDAQGYLGIQGTNIDAATSQMYGMPVGIYVYKIVEGGAASSSDLKEKDIITKFDGQSVTSMEELKQMLTYYEGGAAVTLTVQSLVDGAYVEHDVQVTLGTKPAAQS